MPLHDIFSAESPRRRPLDASDESRQGRAPQSSLFVSWSHPVAPSASDDSQQEQRPFPSLGVALDEDEDVPRRAMPTSGGGKPMHSSTAGSPFSKNGSNFHDHWQQLRHAPPTRRDCSQHETNQTTSPASSRGGHARLPTHYPQLRIRPITLLKKPKMPSPLARRGAAERAYLQGQMRAESLRRRKQEQHNAERKLMANANDIMMPINKDDLNNENVPSDGQIETMIENFNAGFAGLGQHPEDLDRNHHHSTFPPKKKNNPLYQMSLASSPPAILKKSFKRSVSAVLADSGIAENGNLLFFPSGVPLLDEEGEIDIDGDSPDSAHGRHGLAGRDGSSADNVKAGSAFEESSSTVDYSPSLVAADIILQLEGELVMTNPMTKKVTLRPKMNAPNNNNTTNGPQLTSIDSCISEGNSLGNQSESTCQVSPCIGCNTNTSHEDDRTFPFASGVEFHSVGGEVLNASESFKQLSFANEIGKLRAESLLRRKQEHHTAERKFRENANDFLMPMDGFNEDNVDPMTPMDSFNDENVATDVQIQLLIEKFEFGFANLMHHNEHDPMSRASSPPTVLKKSFKRSVSAVFADSGIAENGNLLFFPSGVPHLDENGELVPRDDAERAFVMDTDSPNSVCGRADLVRGDAENKDNIESGSASEGSSTTDDRSPSLVAADVIWQLGTCGEGELVMTNPLSKKVTLRPKMNAPYNNITHGPQSTPIDSCISEGNSSVTRSERKGQAAPCIGYNQNTSHEEERTFLSASSDEFHFVGGEFLNASESFMTLSFADEIRYRVDSADGSHSLGGGIINASESFKQLSLFSSPADRSNHQMFRGEPPTSSSGDFSFRESLPDTNYCTPDNSEHHRQFRKQVGERMPKLPELEKLSDASEECRLFPGKATSAVDNETQFEILLEDHVSDPNYRTLDNSEHGRLARKQVGWMGQLPKPMPTAVESNAFQSGIVLKNSLSEFSYRTPDNSESRGTRKQVGWIMPQSQELLPRLTDGLDKPALQSKAHEENVCFPKEFSIFPEEFASITPLSESKYRTPDNSFQDRFSSRIDHFDRMPKLPELGLPITTLNQF